MRKKLSVLLMMACGLFSTMQAQEFNLFDPADVDENGWLWFDTQAKIDKYIGQADNDNGLVNPNGKIIQLVSADYDPYPDTTVDVNQKGAGTDKNIGGPEAKTGAIITAGASANMSTNGGGFIVRMPSCTTFSMMLSSEGSTYVRLLGTTDESTRFQDYTVVSAKFASVFKPLLRGGQFTWTEMETLESGFEPVFVLKSEKPITAYFQSLSKLPIYIHGIKVTTSTKTSGINEVAQGVPFNFDGKQVTLGEESNIEVYSITGMRIASRFAANMNLSSLEKGIYLVKVNQDTHKIAIQ